MRRALGPLAVPAAVGHLLAQQVLDDAMHAVVRQAEVAQEGQNHAGDARLAVFERLEEVDAAVAVEAGVQQQLAAPPRLGIVMRQAQMPQQEQGVGGGGPLRRVKRFGPRAGRVLQRQQSRAPALSRDTGAVGFVGFGRLVQQIAPRLPADGRVAVEQPGEMGIGRHGGLRGTIITHSSRPGIHRLRTRHGMRERRFCARMPLQAG